MVVIDPKRWNRHDDSPTPQGHGAKGSHCDRLGITSAFGLSISRFNLLRPSSTRKYWSFREHNVAFRCNDYPVGPKQSVLEWIRQRLYASIGYVATHEDGAENRHLDRVRDLLLLDNEDMQVLHKKMLKSHYHFVKSASARALQQKKSFAQISSPQCNQKQFS